MSSRYESLIEAAKREIVARREKKLAQFECAACGTHFDTSIGIARHTANGCKPFPPAAEVPNMPSCPACGSYAVRQENGDLVCDTCGKWDA